jgi:putative transposase
MSFTQIIYHIVFATKERHPVLAEAHREELLQYMWGAIKEKQGHLYRINATEDHVHILTSLHPTVALASFLKDIKVASSKWMKEHGGFPGFQHWQDSYSAFTHSAADKDRLIEYIKEQQEHHRKVSYLDELRGLLEEAGVDYDERYLK